MSNEREDVNDQSGLFAARLGSRLRELRGPRSQKDFAAHLGVGANTLGRYESGERVPDTDFIWRVCKAEKVSANWLFGSDSAELSDAERAALESPEVQLSATTASRDPAMAYVPYYDIPISAGAGRLRLDHEPALFICYRRDYLHRRGLNSADLIELPIAGDSMSPELESGDTVLVDRSRTNIAGDGIYVISMDEMLYCKRLQLLPGRKLRVISINPAYAPYDVALPGEDDQGEHIEIIGRVVRQGRDR